MSDLSARLDLPLIKPSQAQKHVTHNEALQILDGLVQAVIEEAGAETPPFEPVTGQLFALGPSPTGDWAGMGGTLALRAPEAWLFLTPRAGWRAWDKAAGRYLVHAQGSWTEVTPELENLDGIGVGTTSDATNRLAVSSPSTLLTHEGAGHRVKVNKNAADDTASLLFQTGWTGHAEMGLAGVNDWSIKVSPDGSNWTEALKIDKASGLATGEAVQGSAIDTTPGRLLKLDGDQGSFGLGGKFPPVINPVIQDNPAGFFQFVGADSPFLDGAAGYGIQARRFGGTIEQAAQLLFKGNTNSLFLHKAWGGSYKDPAEIYHTGNLVGTVSVDGNGIPTGAVIERGSNANGEYVRFADGTQICTHQAFTTSAAGPLVWTYPAAFVYPASPGRPAVSGAISTLASQTAVLGIGGISGPGGVATEVNVWARQLSTDAFVERAASLIAIGRWF